MRVLNVAFQLMFLSIVSNTYAAGVLHYILLPDSTITPYDNATIAGPTELLTGSFDWVQFDTASSIIGFDATNLTFQSESFLVELNTTTLNDAGTSVFPDSCLTYFSEVVDVTGFVAEIGRMSSPAGGCYSGPTDHPTSLSYPMMSIYPYGGGQLFAILSVSAALDSDRDGVPDTTDQCPDTATGSMVDAHGCSIDQLAPCAGPRSGGVWKNHGQYISTIVAIIDDLLAAGRITQEQKEALIKAKAQSNCGMK